MPFALQFPHPLPSRLGVLFYLSLARLSLMGLVLALVMPSVADAAFLGDPTPRVKGAFEFRHSMTVDHTERKLATSRWNSPVTLRSTRIAAIESYGLVGWRDLLIEVSGIIGIERTTVDFGLVTLGPVVGNPFWDKFAPDVPHNANGSRQLSFEGKFGPIVGGGVRAQLLEWRGAAISVGGQVTHHQNSDTGQPSLDLAYNEWDMFGGLSWDRRLLSLYAGYDQSWLVGEVSTPDPTIATDLDQENLVGAFAGIHFHFYRHWDLATEMRLVNQSSVTLQVQYEF